MVFKIVEIPPGVWVLTPPVKHPYLLIEQDVWLLIASLIITQCVHQLLSNMHDINTAQRSDSTTVQLPLNQLYINSARQSYSILVYVHDSASAFSLAAMPKFPC